MVKLDEMQLLQLISTEPCILFIESNFDILKEEHKKVYDLSWSCVFTSSNDERISSFFNKLQRLTRDITLIEQLNRNALDKKNLKIVRLFNDTQLSGRSA